MGLTMVVEDELDEVEATCCGGTNRASPLHTLRAGGTSGIPPSIAAALGLALVPVRRAWHRDTTPGICNRCPATSTCSGKREKTLVNAASAHGSWTPVWV